MLVAEKRKHRALPDWQKIVNAGAGADNMVMREARMIAPGKLKPMLGNPRRGNYAAAMEELVADIRLRGLLVPLLVRPVEDGMFEVIAGSRRLLAAQMCDLALVPVVIRPMDDDEAQIVALVENIQHQQLDPADEGQAFVDLYGRVKSLREVGALVNKSKDYVRKRMILVLTPGAVEKYEEGRIGLEDLVSAVPAGAAAVQEPLPSVPDLAVSAFPELKPSVSQRDSADVPVMEAPLGPVIRYPILDLGPIISVKSWLMGLKVAGLHESQRDSLGMYLEEVRSWVGFHLRELGREYDHTA